MGASKCGGVVVQHHPDAAKCERVSIVDDLEPDFDKESRETMNHVTEEQMRQARHRVLYLLCLHAGPVVKKNPS